MSENSSIEWTDATWNPVRGCDKISPGCANCYAERFAERWRGVAGHPYEHGFDLKLAPQMLSRPLLWKNPQRIFVNSMSDLFHKNIPLAYVSTVFRVMQMAHWHTYQVLTKRAAQMLFYSISLEEDHAFASKLPHVWWGVSVEDRLHGLPRIAALQDSPVACRFLSIEPLLEDLGELNLAGISWVIVGGESGPGARPMQRDWVAAIRDQCAEWQVPFFFKQWGSPQKAAAGRELDGVVHDAMPALAAPAPIDRSQQKANLAEVERMRILWSKGGA